MNPDLDPHISVFPDLEELRKADDMEFADAVYHAAMCYAKADMFVVPLEPGAKKLPSGGGINYLSATNKESTVKKWFGPEGKYRGFNIGIGCGMEGGVMAMDVDSKPVNGTTGLKELAKILEKEGPLPLGPQQRTPSGGFHYLYRWKENAGSSSSKVAPGIDTRGGTGSRCTGHIVVYPSIVGDKVYTWEEGGEIPDMPKWLSESLGEPWKERTREVQKTEVPVHQINRMLTILDPDSLGYEDWVRVGMALKSTCGDDGLEFWDNWSEQGSRRKEGECKSRWKTFDEDGPVGFGTLLFMAKEAGWRPLPGDVSGSSIDSDIEEQVLQMNKKYALVRVGKNTIIATFHRNPDGVKVGFLNMMAFQSIAAPDKIQVPTRNGFSERSMSDIWMASPQRREYHDMGIYPNNDAPSGVLNMWNGWAVEPNPNASCELYLKHMLEIICGGNKNVYEWLLDWMADAVQDSRNVKGCCVVLRGIEGCGKGAWADTFCSLFGKHYVHLIDSERLTSKFNSITTDSIMVYADEVIWPGDRKAANILKGMITERKIVRESKGVDSIEVDNLMHVIIASNEDWIIPAGPQSRRWMMLNVKGHVAQSRPYFDRLFHEIENGGKSALLYFLMHRKITNNLRTAPKTSGLMDQRMMSHRHDSVLHFYLESVARGGFNTIDMEARMGDVDGWPNKVIAYELFNEYRIWARDNRISVYDTLALSMFYKKSEEFGFKNNGNTMDVPPLEDLKLTIDHKQGIEKGEAK
jgi:hypothetical protein